MDSSNPPSPFYPQKKQIPRGDIPPTRYLLFSDPYQNFKTPPKVIPNASKIANTRITRRNTGAT